MSQSELEPYVALRDREGPELDYRELCSTTSVDCDWLTIHGRELLNGLLHRQVIGIKESVLNRKGSLSVPAKLRNKQPNDKARLW